MTGGVLPEPFDTIIPVEQIKFDPNKRDKKYIIINHNIKKYLHVRFKGSDYKKNDLIIKKGTIILPNHILALETLGIHKVKVKKNQKQPDYWGYFKINGKIYDVASWIHSNKENTSKYLSLVIKDYVEYKPDTEL